MAADDRFENPESQKVRRARGQAVERSGQPVVQAVGQSDMHLCSREALGASRLRDRRTIGMARGSRAGIRAMTDPETRAPAHPRTRASAHPEVRKPRDARIPGGVEA